MVAPLPLIVSVPSLIVAWPTCGKPFELLKALVTV
jgi:hypothetical protein